MVVIASMFRDSIDYLDRYFDQVQELDQMIPVRLCIAEGDSKDNTYNELDARMQPGDQLLKVDHGGPRFGSVDLVDRWQLLAYVCNTIMEHVPENETLIYVESDLIWNPSTMLLLLDDLDEVPAVAPLSMKDDWFYDTYGHRGLDGERFKTVHPYHVDLANRTDLVEIGSAGSCIAMRPEIAEKARFGDTDCVVGLGQSIRDNGFSLWLDPLLSVVHP